MIEILVYVAGPYSSDPEGGTERAMDAGDRLEDAGLVAVIPHMSHFRHLRRPRDYAHWMRVDKAVLLRCDALLRIPGESSGAEQEIADAIAAGIPVFHAEAELLAWARIPPPESGATPVRRDGDSCPETPAKSLVRTGE